MAEVFTIAGAPMGALGQVASCPAGWVRTPNGNCGGAPPTYKSPVAATLQQALNVKGAGLSVDGVIGPLTVAAINNLLGTKLGIAEAAAQATSLTDRVRAASIPAATAPQVPSMAVDDGVVSPWLWALLGLELLAVGAGAYGLTKRESVAAATLPMSAGRRRLRAV